MSHEFGLTPDKLSWVVTAFLIPTAACLLPMGKVSDIYGRRKTYAAALLAFALTTAAAALATTLPREVLERETDADVIGETFADLPGLDRLLAD